MNPFASQTKAIVVFAWMFVASSTASKAQVDFAKEIQPIFEKHCYECHGEKKQKSGFRLDSKEIVFRGGESGKPAIVAGTSAGSQLVKKVSSTDPDEMMPPKGERLS